MNKGKCIIIIVFALVFGMGQTAFSQSFDERLSYQKYIKSYDYDKALEALKAVPTDSLTSKEVTLLDRLQKVIDV
jgi:hypothetical protein